MGDKVEFRGHLLTDGFAPVSHTLIRTKRLGPIPKLILILLISRASKDGSSYPGQESIATALGISKRSVVRGVQELKSLNILSSNRRGQGQTNIYILNQDSIDSFIAADVQSRSDTEALPVAEVTHGHLQKCQEVTSRNAPQSHKEYPVEEYPIKNNTPPSTPPQSTHDAKKEDINNKFTITETFRERMVEKYAWAWSADEVRLIITIALDHRSAKKYTNMELYLQNWLRNEAKDLTGRSNDAKPQGHHKGLPYSKGVEGDKKFLGGKLIHVPEMYREKLGYLER